MARTKKIESTPVRIRFKELENGNKSIYLDIYYEKKRRYEFLKLYLIPENSSEARKQNKHTMKAADAIRAQRILEISNNRTPVTISEKAKVLLVDWVNEYKNRSIQQGKTSSENHVHSALKQLRKYNAKARLCDVDKDFLDGFVEFMKGQKARRTKAPFAKKTISNYLGVIITALNMAVDDDVLSVNPGLAIDRKAICGEETPREYLTIDEVRKLIEADAPRADVKIAFLFSCFCGLRLSDVRALQWKKIIEDNGNIHMELRQKKTGRMLYLPLNKQAQAYLPHTKRSAEDYVFSLPCTSTIDLQLKKWAKNAGINKKLTYHMSRHTFATMELTMGADLYTTSQLLGHADVETTQVYAKIIDAKKEAAVLLLDSLF